MLRTSTINKHLVIKDAALLIFFFTHLLKDFLSGLPLSPGGVSSLLPQRVVSTIEKIQYAGHTISKAVPTIPLPSLVTANAGY